MVAFFTNTRPGQEAEQLDRLRGARNLNAAGDSEIGAIQKGSTAPPLGTLHGVPVSLSLSFSLSFSLSPSLSLFLSLSLSLSLPLLARLSLYLFLACRTLTLSLSLYARLSASLSFSYSFSLSLAAADQFVGEASCKPPGIPVPAPPTYTLSNTP